LSRRKTCQNSPQASRAAVVERSAVAGGIARRYHKKLEGLNI
jgi:hypothetical protein